MDDKAMRANAEPAPSDSTRWVDRPTGGALKLVRDVKRQGTSVTVELELVYAKGRPWWFWHVEGVPVEVSAAQA